MHKIFIADSRLMPEVDNESVHLIIVSPPSWESTPSEHALQTPFSKGAYEDYINNLNLVWMECHRVLYSGCRLCIHIADQSVRIASFGRFKVIPIRTEIIKFCETIGFDYMGAIIWQKAKAGDTKGSATIIGSYLYPRNGVVKIDYEFVLIFKKPGNPPLVSREIKEQSRLSAEEWNEYFSGHWRFPGEKHNKDLPIFAEELPGRLIRMFSFVGETVLDPFLGIGTTSLAAKRLQRSSLGYEINESLFPVIRKKLGAEQADIFSEDIIEVVKPARDPIDFQKERQKLPYII
jgi:site-specific DNA-methyltransferase (adenine-specific)